MAASSRAVRAVLPAIAVVLSLSALGACGGDDDGGGGVSLSPEGQAGKQLYESRGCAGCHDSGVAPSFEGLYGSEVTLEDGSTVVADEAYLTRSITDPGAQRVDGYSTKMPTTDLSEEEVAQLVAYIRDLSPSASAGSVTTP